MKVVFVDMKFKGQVIFPAKKYGKFSFMEFCIDLIQKLIVLENVSDSLSRIKLSEI